MSKPRMRAALAILALSLGVIVGPLTVGSASAVTQPGVASTRLPVPSDDDGYSQTITSISCGGTGFCVAVGYYYVPYNSGQGPAPLIETWSGGTWTATHAPVPADGFHGLGSLEGVSCSGSTCAAYGSYATGASTTGYVGLVRSGSGTWTARAVGAPSGDTLLAPNSGATQAINGVGCAGTMCALVGNGQNASSQARAWAATFQNGAWTAHETNTPIDATGQASWLEGISCGGGVCQAAGGYISGVGAEPLIVTVNGDGTTNSPDSHVNIPQGATQINDVNGVACDSGGSCAAYGSYYASGGDGTTANALLMPVGGTGFQPQTAPTATTASTTIHPPAKVYGDACAGGACVFVGYYFDSSNTYQPLLDRFGGSGIGTSVAPNNIIPSGVACGGASFCTTRSLSYGAPLDVLTSSGWVSADLALPTDHAQFAINNAYEQASACDSATSCWVLGQYPAASGTSQVNALFAAHVTPTPVAAPPTVSLSSLPTFALGSSVKFSFHGTAGSSPIDHYTVQVRRSTWKSGFGSWSTPSGWGTLSASTSSVSVSLPVGDDTCVRVQAVDTAHMASAWSSARCTARPLDDRALSASSAWARLKASGFYLGTYTSTKSSGATMTLSGAEFDRLALVATKCASCGKVAVYSGSTLLGTINLYKSTTAKEQVIALPKVSYRTANIRLKVTTSGKTIQIDGLGVSRT
ncbi:MAG: hypothetical protein ACTHJM_10955 [Marmoricola sp.]